MARTGGPVSQAPAPQVLIDMQRAYEDFPYYASRLLFIRTKARTFQRFNQWYPGQIKIWQSIQADLEAGRPVRKIILKCRQTGASTLSEALLFWQVHTRPNTHALVLSMDIDSARYIYEMSRNFYESLPEEVKPLKRYSSKKEIVLENPDEKTRSANPGLKSRVEVQTAGKYTPPRGANFNLVHFSEVAFWPNAEEIVPAIIPMVPDLPETMIIYESTANGVDNFFCRAWRSAKAGDSIFDPIFISWVDMPEYRMEFVDQDEREEFAEELDEDELELIKAHKLSLEQLKWRRWKIDGMDGDVDKFRQEYPATEDEAFIYSGFPVFPKQTLRRIKTRDPIWTGDIDLYTESLKPTDEGHLDVWEDPHPDADYVIGVDVSSGSGEDYSCMCVLRKTWPQGLAEQVAEWHGKVDPVQLGKMCVVLARHYNNAMLSIEINNHGLTTQVEAQRSYWHFYRWQYFDRIGRTYTPKVGWETNITTKPILVNRTVASLKDGLVGVSSEALLQEMWDYTQMPGSVGYEAESGHDDRVMAFMISLTTLFIETPEADFVVGAGAPVIAPDGTLQPTQLGNREILVAPLWDRTDPRGQPTQDEKDWRSL